MTAIGTQAFSHFQTGKESTAGDAVAATRRWYPDGTGVIDVDNVLNVYQGNRGRRVMATGGIEMGEKVTLNYRSNPNIGLLYDELPFILGQLDGGNTASGSLANKTWTIAPSLTGANSQESYTIEAGDDTKNYEFEYAQLSEFTIGASRDTLTSFEGNWFARQMTQSTKTALSSNVPMVAIPGYLWKMRFATSQAGLSGASDQDNLLLDWSGTFTTGLVPQFSLDGNKYFGQSVEAVEQTANFTFHFWSQATTITQFVDKWRSQTVDFFQLKATGPTLGSANYSAQLQAAVLYTMVKPIGSEVDGMNVYEVNARLVDDPTWDAAQAWSVVCSTPSIA